MKPTETTGALRLQLQNAMGSPFDVQREVGRGGMSRVFLAEDRALGRKIVVKILAPELKHGVSAARFEREMALAAHLQHPNIVPLIATGTTAEGLPYYTMPFIEGESLRQRLARTGELSVPNAIRIARDVAAALAFAHARGVVHRDIKPENILFDGDLALLTDLGVAKALDASTIDRAIGPQTTAGVAVGTPTYMSPEQAAGDPSIDHRADLYALGIILYEMLTGHPPFAGRTMQAILAAHAAEIPVDVGKRRPATPIPVAKLVMKCLEKNPADRPRKADELVRALDEFATPSGHFRAPPPSALRRAARSRAVWIIGIAAGVVALARAAIALLSRFR